MASNRLADKWEISYVAEMATQQINPELLQAAKHSPVLAYMIKNGLPLNRETWIEVNYGGDSEIPKPWTAEDEMQVPPLFRRPLHAD